MRSRHPLVMTVAWGLTAGLLAGCDTPSRIVKYPEGSLQVQFEDATAHSTCLVASVAMAANYLLGERVYTEAGIRQALHRAGLYETRVGDLQTYLANEKLHMVVLKGTLDGKPPLSLRYWLQNRGYPVICVINRRDNSPSFNHAVVAIGISRTLEGPPADSIHYLDPASPLQLHSEGLDAFETLWARGENAMMIVVAPPPDAGSDPVR